MLLPDREVQKSLTFFKLNPECIEEDIGILRWESFKEMECEVKQYRRRGATANMMGNYHWKETMFVAYLGE